MTILLIFQLLLQELAPCPWMNRLPGIIGLVPPPALDKKSFLTFNHTKCIIASDNYSVNNDCFKFTDKKDIDNFTITMLVFSSRNLTSYVFSTLIKSRRRDIGPMKPSNRP